MLMVVDNKFNLLTSNISLISKVGILTHTKNSHVEILILNVKFISTTLLKLFFNFKVCQKTWETQNLLVLLRHFMEELDQRVKKDLKYMLFFID